MNRLKLSLVALALAVSALACATNTNTGTTTNTGAAANANSAAATNAAPAATPDELAAARKSYSEFCVRCHKESGEGGLVDLGDGEKPFKVPSLKQGHALEHSDAELARTISNGDDEMPAFKKRLSEQQINDLVRFVRREFQGKSGTGAATSNANANAHD